MDNPLVSLFCSAVRPKLWPSLINSLKGTSVEYEIVFCGNVSADINIPIDNLKYFRTGDIKPSTCYEIARRNCKGKVGVWIADDMEFPNNVIGKAYDYWKSQGNEKLILSIQTKETGYEMPKGELFPMDEHCFYGRMKNTPLMAPVAMMSRSYLEKLGGIDIKYVCGQYENDIVMRAYADGAKVEIFGDKDCYIDIDHLGKSIAIGESFTQEDFIKRPFATGYQKDREVLENSWTTFDPRDIFLALQRGEQPLTLRKVSPIQLDEFQPYPENIPLDYSLSNKGKWK